MIDDDDDFDLDLAEDSILNETTKYFNPPKDGWYLKETSNSRFYSPFCLSQKSFQYVPGEEKDIIEFIKANPDWDSYGNYTNIFRKHNDKKTQDEPTRLPGGCYMHRNGDYTTPERLIPFSPRQDTYIPLKMEEQVKKDFNKFLGAEQLYRDLGIMFKMGILMYSTAGLGKTSIIRDLVHNVDKDAVVIWLEGQNFFSTDFSKKIATTLKDRFKVFIFEELTHQTSYTERLERLLTFLDGELTIDKSISIATTNYPELLPMNVVDRPSRFDKLYEMKPPDSKERKKLLTFFLKGQEPTDAEVAASDKLSPAQLKEVALMHLVHEFTVMDSIAQLKARTKKVEKAFAEAKKETGFGFG